jgi:hypothetical protein
MQRICVLDPELLKRASITPPRSASGAEKSRLIAAGILGISIVVLAQTTAQLIDYGLLDLKLEIINSNGDGGLFGIVGILALVLAAVATWAAVPRLPRARRTLIMLAPLLTFLAIDKGLRIHDDVPHWLVLYLPLLAVALLLLLRLARQTSLDAGRLIVSALALLVVAFVLHQFGDSALGRLHTSPTGWLYQVKGATKHGAELAGWLLVGLGVAVACADAGRPDLLDGRPIAGAHGSPRSVLRRKVRRDVA